MPTSACLPRMSYRPGPYNNDLLWLHLQGITLQGCIGPNVKVYALSAAGGDEMRIVLVHKNGTSASTVSINVPGVRGVRTVHTALDCDFLTEPSPGDFRECASLLYRQV